MPDNVVQLGVDGVDPDEVHKKKSRFQAWMIFVLLAGVGLPVAAFTLELVLRICSSIFFDPIPTVWHIILLSIVPIANLIAVVAYLRGGFPYMTPLTFLLGISFGTEIVYSLQFLPLTPFSLLGLICFGMGLCGFSPYLAFASTWICLARLREIRLVEAHKNTKLLWSGVFIGVFVLGVFILTALATTIGLRMAVSNDEATSQRGVKLIRTFGSDSVLLRACYELPTGIWSDPAGLAGGWNPESREQARTTYYKVTGRSFNSVPAPTLFGLRSELTSDFEFDSDVGGTAVNSRVDHLSLSSSRIDAVIDPDALTAYTEWTLLFTNLSSTEREARAEIALPPGGIVSRLTLWVDGEEREAAFSSRGTVRNAYQQVAVVQRRDPVVVTTCGPDRVLMQCFPVPMNGGIMKVRIGITSPLAPKDYSEGIFMLPHFVERNFGIPNGVKHSLFIESPREMIVGGAGLSSKGVRCFRAVISDTELAGTESRILCSRNASVRQVWAPDKFEPGRYAIVQTLAESDSPAPKNVIIVIDGSQKLKDARREIASALQYLPDECDFSVIMAADKVRELAPIQSVSRRAVEDVQKKVLAAKYIGGIDNRPALLRACDAAIERANSVVLWIHGPQPLASNAYTEQMLQLSERRPGSVRILAVAAADGRNSILADLEKTGIIVVVPRKGTLAADLRQLFAEWRSDSHGSLIAVRERVPLLEVKNCARTSSHLCRLWARDEVMRICRLADSRKLPAAAKLAARYQLVTPVSGAVVLENEEQYIETGLKPVDPSSVPAIIPEPASWIALAVGIMLVVVVRCRKARSRLQLS